MFQPPNAAGKSFFRHGTGPARSAKDPCRNCGATARNKCIPTDLHWQYLPYGLWHVVRTEHIFSSPAMHGPGFVYQLWSSYILVFWRPAALTPFGSVTDLANCNKEWFTDSKCKPEDSAALRHDFAPSANKMVPSLRTLRIKSLLRPELWHIVAIGPRQVWSTQVEAGRTWVGTEWGQSTKTLSKATWSGQNAGVGWWEIANPISLLTLLGIMSRPRALQSALVALWTQIWLFQNTNIQQSLNSSIWRQAWHTWTGPCSVLPGSGHHERHVFQEYIVLLYT